MSHGRTAGITAGAVNVRALIALTVGMVPADPKPARRKPQTGVASNPNRRQLLTSPPHCLFKRLAALTRGIRPVPSPPISEKTHTTAALFKMIQIPPDPQSKPGPSQSKRGQANPNKIAWICLVLFVRIMTYQWVTAIQIRISPLAFALSPSAPRQARLRFLTIATM
jgi:hypothetical protein